MGKLKYLTLTLLLWAITTLANTPPTRSAYADSGYGAHSGATFSIPSVTWGAGDAVVVIGGTEGANSSDTLGTPTVTGLTFTLQASLTPTSRSAAYVWSAVAGSAGSGSISVPHTAGSGDAGASVWVYTGVDAVSPIGNVASSGTSAKTVSLTPTQADSAVVWGVFDWAAAALQTITPTPTTTDVRTVFASIYTVYIADLTDQTSAGATSYGISGTGTGPFSIVALEIKGTTGGGGGGGSPHQLTTMGVGK